MSFFLSIVVFIFVLPIRISFKLRYVDKKFNIYVYNINITKRFKFFNKKTLKKHKIKEKWTVYFDNLKSILQLIGKNKFKPTIKLKLNVTYGLDDAAYTAVSYGLISASKPLILKLLSYPFKIKSQYIYILPDFNKPALKLELDSIIFVSLAKVIYIAFILYRNLKTNKKIKFAKT